MRKAWSEPLSDHSGAGAGKPHISPLGKVSAGICFPKLSKRAQEETMQASGRFLFVRATFRVVHSAVKKINCGNGKSNLFLKKLKFKDPAK